MNDVRKEGRKERRKQSKVETTNRLFLFFSSILVFILNIFLFFSLLTFFCWLPSYSSLLLFLFYSLSPSTLLSLNDPSLFPFFSLSLPLCSFISLPLRFTLILFSSLLPSYPTYHLTGRSKEIINRGGETISPFEIEEAVQQYPSVKEVLAFSAPHDQVIHRLFYYLVPNIYCHLTFPLYLILSVLFVFY